MLNGWHVLFQNIYINDVIHVLGEETDRLTEKHDRGGMSSSNKTQCNTERLDRTMCLSGIFLNDNGNCFSHDVNQNSQVNDKKGSQASIIPERTTRPQSEILGSIFSVET